MTGRRVVNLLEVDPDLGGLLEGERLLEGRRQLIVRVHVVERGPWDAERLRSAGPEHVGLLILDGVIARELVLEDNVSAELLGPGDIVRPWQIQGPESLLQAQVRWTVLEAGRLAVLDRNFAAQLARFPEVNAMVIDRLTERTQRLAMTQAISQLNGVERRLLALFWHLAERWGRIRADGVAVPVALPHRIVAQLVGARRPTVSTALGHLAERGALARLEDGTWLLTGEPVGLPTDEAARVIQLRRRRFDRESGAPGQAAGLPPPDTDSRLEELHESLARLRARSEAAHSTFEALRDESAAIADRIAAGRAARTPRPRRR